MALLAACAKDETGTTPAPSSDTSVLPPGTDGSATGDDASSARDAPDSASADAGVVNGPGGIGAECSFNRDCQAALRCECDPSTGCACKTGVRGSGKNGVDSCTTGNACSSAVCIEGPPDSGFFCSDECDSSADCKGKLPLCSTIAFVGRVCIRQN